MDFAADPTAAVEMHSTALLSESKRPAPNCPCTTVYVQPVHLGDRPLNSSDGLDPLDACERERAGRFRDPRDRERFVVGRVLMRRVLAVLMQTTPAAVPLAVGRRGKPVLGIGGPHFNLAHSGVAIAFAWSFGGPVGVDVEMAATDARLASIARGALTEDERRTLLGLDAAARAAALLRFWTLKEAVAKAHGDGLSLMKRFAIRFDGVGPPRLQTLDPALVEGQWHLFEFRCGEAVGAVASIDANGDASPRPRLVVHAPVSSSAVLRGARLEDFSA
jgi:phosphopantetheinyl transferase